MQPAVRTFDSFPALLHDPPGSNRINRRDGSSASPPPLHQPGLKMSYYLTKILITVALIVAISEIAKRSSLIAAVLASIPLVSVLAMLWLYWETRDTGRISAFASSVFWLVLPSLSLFLVLPWLLKKGLHFYLSLGLAVAATVACYSLTILVLGKAGIRL